MANFLSDQSPEAKRTRTILAIGVGGLVALIFLMRGRGEAPPAADEGTALGAGIAGATVPSTFADNGEAMGNLSTQVAAGLGEVGTALESVSASQGALAETLADLNTPPAQPAPAAIAASGSPAPPARTTYKGQPGSWTFKGGRWTWIPAAGTKPPAPKGLGAAKMRSEAKRLKLRGVGHGQYTSGSGALYKWTGRAFALIRGPKPKPKPKPGAHGRR